MRILFYSHYFPPEVNAPASRTYEHCVRWVRSGHEVTVVTCVPNCPDGVVFKGYRNRWRPQVEWVDGIRVVRVWTYIAPNSGTSRRIINYLTYMLSAGCAALFQVRPDVIVATSPQFFCGWAGIIASWVRWRPLVLEIRDIWPESIVAVGAMRKGLTLRFLEWLERLMYRSARHIVAVGNGYRDQVLSKVDVGQRISVITNGVDTQLFQPQPPCESLLRSWRLSNRFVCSYVGTIGMAHGLDVVVSAARTFKRLGRNDIVFLLVGDGAERARLQTQVADEELDDLVVFTGRLPREQMPAVLASSDVCLVHLRKSELFETVIPSKIFETIAMGKPIIMGVAGEARDMVLAAGAGVAMEPESVSDLVSSVTELADDRSRLRSLASSARFLVLENFNRDDLAQKYLSLLTQIAEGKATVDLAVSPRVCTLAAGVSTGAPQTR